MIIGIIGKKHSGKTTTANFLKDELEGSTSCVNFADALKQEVADACHVSINFIEKNKDNFRLILQGWGTDFRRKLYSEGYWIARVEDHINRSDFDNFIIADVRFQNEAALIKGMGGKLIRVYREKEKGFDMHQSEVEMESIVPDHIILNHTTLDGLKKEVKTIADELKL